MLGLPSRPGALGLALLALGLAAAIVFGARFLREHARTPLVLACSVCAAATLGSAPFFVWRLVEDVRYTTSLNRSDYDGAGPIQAFLQPYLLDTVPALIPRGDTYMTAVGAGVPYDAARKAFPSLALQTLFPRISVASARDADWVVAWGVDPRSVAPVRRVVVARPRSGAYPALLVARVRR